MIKKIFIVLALAAVLGCSAQAQEVYNYARGRLPVGTFSNNLAAVDDSLGSFAVSGDIGHSPQFLTIDMETNIYVGSVKIFWDADALSRSYSIRVSKDKKNWLTEFSGLDASVGAKDAATGTVAQIISTRRYTTASRYLQIYIPIGSSASASRVRIAEIQVLPALDLSFELEDVRPYVIGDHSAIIVYRTSIGAVDGQVFYGRDPGKLDMIAANMESGVINSATLVGLEPGLAYFYRVKAWDAYGEMLESEVNSFRPLGANLALGKKISGTFVYLPPNDDLVDKSKDVLSRVADGVTGYFKGMATSGSIQKGDQYVVIDLGKSYALNSIVSYWRALAYPESFSVSVSEDNQKWTEISSKINAGEGAFARSDAGDPMRVVNTGLKGARARFVKISMAKESPYFVKHADWDFVQLMEVEVFAR
jgi:hypothetical protein